MIADHLEPRGLLRDAEPLTDDYPALARQSASAASQKLLAAILLAQGKPLPAPRVRDYIWISPNDAAQSITQRVQEVVSGHFGIPQSEMTSDRRARKVSRPRQIAMYLVKEMTPKSMPAIGRCFGNRDHTTVMHGIQRIGQLIEEDADVAQDVAIIRARLGVGREMSA